MKLRRLEVQNYRSIKHQIGGDAIDCDALNCLVGENNAGKSNILKAITFLLRGETDRLGLHYNHDPSNEIEVRGYFEVEDSDFDRLKITEKRDAVREQVLPDGTFGIYRSSEDGNLQVLGLYPSENRLRPDAFVRTRDLHWDDKTGGADYRDRMIEDFPEVAPYVEDGKETQKSAWKHAYDAFVGDKPDDVEFVELPGPPKQGIPADLLNLLPEPLVIPAVKEVSDATRTSSRAELGALLSAVSEEIQEELDEAIAAALESVTRQLNIIEDPESGEEVDERHPSVRQLEDAITGYVQETFSDHEVEFEFPPPRSSVLFDEAQVWIREAGFDRVPVEDVGEGVKRILIFSLIRTLADLRHGDFSVGASEGDSDDEKLPPRKPYVILYEEAELFLHPALQAILLDALSTLAAAGDQTFFSTHSPFMVPTEESANVHVVRKETNKGTHLLEVASKFSEYDPNVQRRLFGIQHLQSYIFSDCVVLVEGDSDRIVLKKLARILDVPGDFDRDQVPVLSVSGRDNIPIFRTFLMDLEIRTFVMTDLDAVRSALAQCSLGEDAEEHRGALLDAAGTLIQEGEAGATMNRDEAEQVVWECTWSDLFERLEEFRIKLDRGDEPNANDYAALTRLLDLRSDRAIKEALGAPADAVATARESLQATLIEDDILLLDGDLEDYYPDSGGNKINSALEFDPSAHSVDELREHFREIPEEDTTDVELFLGRIFSG